MPRVLLRLEGAAIFAVAFAVYFHLGGGWLMLVLLFLAPDLSMLGYLANPRVGSVIYNLVHTYVAPLVLVGLCTLYSLPLGIQLALIWIAHLGADRMLGFGLKYPTGFKDTHLNRV